MSVRTAFDFNRGRSGLVCKGPSRTKQSFKEECDINVIMKRFRVTGMAPVAAALPQYGDFDSLVDFQTAQNAVIAARNSFNSLPAAVRKRFNNDPQALLEFCADEKNSDEMVKLGLKDKPKVDKVPPVVKPEDKPS